MATESALSQPRRLLDWMLCVSCESMGLGTCTNCGLGDAGFFISSRVLYSNRISQIRNNTFVQSPLLQRL